MASSKEQSIKRSFWAKIKRPLMVLLFVALNVTVIAITAVSEFGNSKEATELSEVKINWWLLIPPVICFLIAITLEIWKYTLLIRKMAPAGSMKKGVDWKLARRTVLLGRYYDNITPAAIGGQPFQIYYLRKNANIPTGLATTIPVFGMISIQISFLIIALLCFLFGNIAKENPALYLTAWFGLLFYAFWPVTIGMATYFPKVTTKIVQLIVRFFAKVHIIKDRDRALKKAEKEIGEYVRCVKLIMKRRGLFPATIVISLVFNILMATIPYFLLTAFGGQMDFMQCFTLTIAVMSAVYFIPTPGNSGAAEGTFFVVFSALSKGYVFWAMLFWRFFSYYIFIIMGPITYFFMHLEKKRDEHKNKKS